ncbi:MAG: diacylglycerol kinase [Mesorhizobium sp.]|uniref:diacylglycerol kinase n=2 Tax=Mesorhizobium sp. TaxID=1871066 RepID=UPI000FE59F65|nr:diacylglycerol kinase [Mesorhizobium sp.]RWI29917.1 MAG: diacylglycerol kinase [Mesorhizobium sp.]RWK50430.1 MAG: diacylglycerol kinase [Mesorhizobium sp.]RWK98289.1 MAG: diacylglycerol kinase [Mesorhizobium sp.]TIP96309.1 MAG: diacylglycerol kinase [Mesorhizobium sp.]TIQ96747.1 MAG: diacylglycerol kinase [Mesorhizobium sp.]
MKKTVVRVVCAIGQAGQLGLKGGLPWEGNRSPEFVADVARFFDLTRGHVLLAGPKTIASVPDFARADRDLVVVRSSMDPEDTLQRFVGRVVFIGGGPPVWDAYARFVSHWDITRLPYDGPADRWFDPRWLTAGGKVARNHRRPSTHRDQ